MFHAYTRDPCKSPERRSQAGRGGNTRSWGDILTTNALRRPPVKTDSMLLFFGRATYH